MSSKTSSQIVWKQAYNFSLRSELLLGISSTDSARILADLAGTHPFDKKQGEVRPFASIAIDLGL